MATVNAVSTREQFCQIINQDKVTIFDFWATWCGPCRVISPVFETLSKIYPSIEFYKIDIDDNQGAAQEACIKAMPTFIAYRNGQELGKVVGAVPEQLKELIQKIA